MQILSIVKACGDNFIARRSTTDCAGFNQLHLLPISGVYICIWAKYMSPLLSGGALVIVVQNDFCGCLVDAFRPSQQFISHVRTIHCLLWLNQCSAEDTKCASGESRTHDPSIPSLTLSQLRHLCWMNFRDGVLYFSERYTDL